MLLASSTNGDLLAFTHCPLYGTSDEHRMCNGAPIYCDPLSVRIGFMNSLFTNLYLAIKTASDVTGIGICSRLGANLPIRSHF